MQLINRLFAASPHKSSAAVQLSHWLAIFLLSLLGACNSPTPPGQPTEIGIVTESEGLPEVTRKNQTYILDTQARIYPGDIIRTDSRSRLKIRMRDATTLALARDTHLVLHQYDDHQNAAPVARLSLSGGALRTVTGAITRTRKPDFEIRTPLAVVGVRGTDFWTGFIFDDTNLDVAMFEGKGVYVRNDHGDVELQAAGFGTTVNPGAAPQAPRLWSARKINAALTATDL
ncbi:MAG: FecR domain-containing protein [Pseudomonadales bacterium]|nr:FecR domain-containing protein [Pseudomonadales bacterium]